jgi:hypothetical protein
MVTEAFLVESEVGAYGPVETAHALVADIITTCLIQDVLPGRSTVASKARR